MSVPIPGNIRAGYALVIADARQNLIKTSRMPQCHRIHSWSFYAHTELFQSPHGLEMGDGIYNLLEY
jgi:hypothetical protein